MLNIKPGMFITHEHGGIYLEVKEAFSDFVICASRDPMEKKELVFISDVVDCVETPLTREWIKLNREKGFYDKLYPEGWQGQVTKVVPFSDLKENDEVIGKKGLIKLIKKVSDGKWKTTGSQKSLSGLGGYFCLLVQRETAPIYN